MRTDLARPLYLSFQAITPWSLKMRSISMIPDPRDNIAMVEIGWNDVSQRLLVLVRVMRQPWQVIRLGQLRTLVGSPMGDLVQR
jgi:hypothetical protein